ncbi:MAG: hypothetical protein MZV70_05820 [Desulfobacterales bacterium]|nr:hypothetical protein [Desulfobacterales bacterium]
MEELWRGLSQFLFLSDLRDGVDADALARGLSALLRSLVGREGMRVNLTADPEALDAARAAVEAALSGILQDPRVSAGLGRGAGRLGGPAGEVRGLVPSRPGGLQRGQPPLVPDRNSGLRPRTGPSATLLSTGYLWDEVRVKGGAYGASAWTDGSESTFSFSSYRDPAPIASLKAFRASRRRPPRTDSLRTPWSGPSWEPRAGSPAHDARGEGLHRFQARAVRRHGRTAQAKTSRHSRPGSPGSPGGGRAAAGRMGRPNRGIDFPRG